MTGLEVVEQVLARQVERLGLPAQDDRRAGLGAADRGGRMSDGRFWRDASGRLTFDVFRVEAADYPAACRAVADAFTLTPDGSPVIGPDQMFWEFRRGGQAVGLDWDVWMGFTVVAKAEASEPLVREIAAWLGSSRWAGAGESA